MLVLLGVSSLVSKVYAPRSLCSQEFMDRFVNVLSLRPLSKTFFYGQSNIYWWSLASVPIVRNEAIRSSFNVFLKTKLVRTLIRPPNHNFGFDGKTGVPLIRCALTTCYMFMTALLCRIVCQIYNAFVAGVRVSTLYTYPLYPHIYLHAFVIVICSSICMCVCVRVCVRV